MLLASDQFSPSTFFLIFNFVSLYQHIKSYSTKKWHNYALAGFALRPILQLIKKVMIISLNDVLKILLCINPYFIDSCWSEKVLLKEKKVFFINSQSVCLTKFCSVLVKGGLFCCHQQRWEVLQHTESLLTQRSRNWWRKMYTAHFKNTSINQ